MKLLFTFSLLFLTAWNSAFGQLTPLPVDPVTTVGMWNFDNDINNEDQQDAIIDSAQNPLNGEGFATVNTEIPGLPSSFGKGRRFSGPSLISLGRVSGSKLDFTSATELSIEAIIHMSSPGNAEHMIVSLENIQLLVINNQLAGRVKQPNGYIGVISDVQLAQNTSYRVGIHIKGNRLVLTINSRVDSKIHFDSPIGAPTSLVNSYIGGTITGKNFPGYIDDVRISNSELYDLDDPQMQVMEPASFNVDVPKPNFMIQISDEGGSGIDPDGSHVFLNGVLQSGLTHTATEISGVLNDDLLAGILNEVKIVISDHQGNTTEKTYYYTLSLLSTRREYETDQNTLALWHMNDFSPGFMEDASSHAHHGYANPTVIGVGEGVFSKAKLFNTTSSLINFDGIRINNKFTFEGWFEPSANYGQDETLFFNGQVTISRISGGQIRVTFTTVGGVLTYSTPETILPLGELHHFAVSWNGELQTGNLKFFKDGIVQRVINAVANCDFDPVPKIGILGQNFRGKIDEVRFSDIDRAGFNIPVRDNLVITFQTLVDGSSVNVNFPEFHAQINSEATMSVPSLVIKLNKVVQPINDELIATPSTILGTFTDPVLEGANELEVSFLDSKGNFRKKTQTFFKISKNGLAQYLPDNKTAGLWHFEDNGFPLNDASGNGAHFSNTYTPVAGKIGGGQKGFNTLSNLNLGCRSYTFEGYFKADAIFTSEVQLLEVGGGSPFGRIGLIPSNGNIHFQMSSNIDSLDVTVPMAVLADSAYHHYALVHDGSRGYSQILLLVDGEVKFSRNFSSSCDSGTRLNFYVGDPYGRVYADEVRVSRVARYAFNLPEGTDIPEIVEQNILNNATVSGAIHSFEFAAEDLEGVNTVDTKLFVNGQAQTLAVEEKSGFKIKFTSSVTLEPGANILSISARDVDGNETLKSFMVFRIDRESPTAYTSDEFTKFLFHFNEVTGDYSDSAGELPPLTRSSWTSAAGRFELGATPTNNNAIFSLGDLSTLEGYTFETWFKMVNSSSVILFSLNNSSSLGLNQGVLTYNVAGVTLSTTRVDALDDGNFHHIAIVINKQNQYRNLYILVDGKVLNSAKFTQSSLTLPVSTNFSLASYLIGSVLDETRFSTTSRFNLVVDRN